MTDEAILSSIRDEAIHVLLEETFTHIHSEMQERYIALARKNALLCRSTDLRFLYVGTVYPPTDVPTIPYGSRIPSLHYSLMNELDTINKAVTQADYHYIKNFFIAAISQSHNAIVLDALLPSVLINALKHRFGSYNFKMLDTGIVGGLQQEPISLTRQNIKAIQDHYKETIATVQHMLMDKLLLQK